MGGRYLLITATMKHFWRNWQRRESDILFTCTLVHQAGARRVQGGGPVILELIPAVTFFTNNDDFLGGQTLAQDPVYSVQGHLIYEFLPALWGALDATYYAGGRTTTDGQKGEQLGHARLGLTMALSMSRPTSQSNSTAATASTAVAATTFGPPGSSGNSAGVEGCR
jgi:hypothetical protein